MKKITYHLNLLELVARRYTADSGLYRQIYDEKYLEDYVESLLFMHEYTVQATESSEYYHHKDTITLYRDEADRSVIIDGLKRLTTYMSLVELLAARASGAESGLVGGIEGGVVSGLSLHGGPGSIDWGAEVQRAEADIRRIKDKLETLIDDEAADKIARVVSSGVVVFNVEEISNFTLADIVDLVVSIGDSRGNDFRDGEADKDAAGEDADEAETCALPAGDTLPESGLKAILLSMEESLAVYRRFNPDLCELSLEALCSRYQAGSREALEILIARSCGIVYNMTSGRRYENYRSEMFIAGLLGIKVAADKFDAGRGYRFFTYARYWVRDYVKREYLKYACPVRFSDEAYSRIMKVHYAHEKARAEAVGAGAGVGGGVGAAGAVVPRVAEDLGLTEQVVRECLQNYEILNSVSLEASLDSEDDGYTIENLYMNNPVEAPEKYAERGIDREVMERHLREIKPAWRDVLIMRYGLDGSAPRTYEAIGHELGVTKQRARAIENMALEKIRATIMKEGRISP